MVEIAERLGRRLNAAFPFADVRLPEVGQLGFVVENLDAARSRYGPMFGVRDWYGAKIRRADLKENDRAVETRLEIAFGYVGPLQIELIANVGRPEGLFVAGLTPDTAIDELHHVGFFVPSMRTWRERLDAFDVATARYGSFCFARRSKTRVAYMDVRPQIGVFAELIEHRVQGQHVAMPPWLIRLGALVGDVTRLPAPVDTPSQATPDRQSDTRAA